MKTARSLVLIILLLSLSGIAFRVFQIERERRDLSSDLIEISKIKYGLFNADEWQRIVSEIIAKKIDQFELGKGNRETWRIKISAFLEKLVNDLEGRFKVENNGSIIGAVKNIGTDFFGVFGQMKEDVPAFTAEILDFLENPTNRKELKKFLNEKIEQYADSTFAETNYVEYNAILARHGYQNVSDAKVGMNASLNELEIEKRVFEISFYVLFILLLLLAIFLPKLQRRELIVLSFASAIPLAGGLFLPMLEIDARIERLAFTLVGEPITFTDQVVYFKSKSILEVISLMFQQGKIDLIAVGALVLLFSVIFPIAKIFSSIVLLAKTRLSNNKFLRFMVFKTGKWSMADVLVVAIFMAYIGFAGILSEQLAQLEQISVDLDVLTTNQSSLQTGFFMFSSFVLLSLCIAQRIGNALENEPE